jgi:putative NADH-flavin reductase
MKVILYGASGRSGSRILKELEARGHDVTAVVRHPENLPAGTRSLRDDLSDVNRIAQIIDGSDAVISGRSY